MKHTTGELYIESKKEEKKESEKEKKTENGKNKIR